MLKGLDLAGMIITLDALHTQRDTARLIFDDHGGHFLMIVHANRPTLLSRGHGRAFLNEQLYGGILDKMMKRSAWWSPKYGRGLR